MIVVINIIWSFYLVKWFNSKIKYYSYNNKLGESVEKMRNKFLVCKLSLAISSAPNGRRVWGSSDGENPVGATTSGHAFQNSLVCADADLNGVCSEQEKLITDVSEVCTTEAIWWCNFNRFSWYGAGDAFHTLIHSEMMFNPTISNDIEQAKASTSKCGWWSCQLLILPHYRHNVWTKDESIVAKIAEKGRHKLTESKLHTNIAMLSRPHDRA